MKEELRLANVKLDLLKVLSKRESNLSDWRFTYIVPATVLAFGLGFLFRSVWIGLIIFSLAAYHVVRYVIEAHENWAANKQLKKAVDRGDFSVSIETLDHISDETIYEPHITRHGRINIREAKFFYFVGGSSWRVPDIYRHYEWSMNYSMSTNGLDSTSVIGNEFHFITLKGDQDIGYIYNTKMFELKEYEYTTVRKGN